MTANQKPGILFPHRSADRTFSSRHEFYPSPPRFHSTSARPATPIGFVLMLLHTTARQSRADHLWKIQPLHPSVPIGQTLPLSVSARPVRLPCDTQPSVAAVSGSVGRI